MRAVMDGTTYYVRCAGELIACTTVLDAAAVKRADSILSECERPFFTKRELIRLARVLDRYGHGPGAVRLRAEARRWQSVEFDPPARFCKER
jgi:hypothetical protein